MVRRKLKVLLIEDRADDVELIGRELRHGGFDPEVTVADTALDMRRALEAGDYDVILCDYLMPTFGAPQALELLQATDRPIPFIIVSGSIGEETAVDILKRGANDYILKENLARLVPAVDRALREISAERERAALESARAQSEARYRSLLANLTIAVVVLDEDGIVRFVNTQACKLLGQSVAPGARIDFETGLEYAAQDETPQAFPSCALGRAVLSREPIRNTLMGMRRAGGTQWQWLLVSTIPPGDAGGSPGEITVTLDDVTALHSAVERIWFQANVLSQISDGVIAVDPHFTITYMNRAAGRLLGLAHTNFAGHPLSAIGSALPWSDEGSARGRLKELFEDSRPVRQEISVPVEGGATRHLEAQVSLLRSESREPAGYLTVLRDVTSRKEYLDSIIHLADIVESAHDAIFSTDKDLRITTCNPSFEHTFGYNRSDVLGHPADLLVPPDLRGEDAELMARIQRGERLTNYFTQRQTKDGRILEVSLTVSPLFDSRGHMIGASFVLQDVSDQRRMERELRQTQKMDALGRLAGGIAHDFNNLLTGILGNANLIASRELADPTVREDLSEITIAAQRAADLTRQLLAFSRRQQMSPAHLNLNDLLDAMVRMLARVVGENIELKTTFASALPPIRGDQSQIEQVFMNIVINARDAMPSGGKLLLSTSLAELDDDYCRDHITVRPGHYILTTITDTGSGMDSEAQRRAFEPFFTTKPPGKGTGLGLPTAYGIVRQSGGHIALYSELGVGTTVKVYLPVAGQESDEATDNDSFESTATGTETILVVEDEDIVRNLVEGVLSARGYEVLAAPTPAEALKISRAHPHAIHLLLSDVVMPEMNGRELARTLAPERPEMHVIFMSGYADDAVFEQGFVDAQHPFIQKPFRPGALAATVRRILDAGKA